MKNQYTGETPCHMGGKIYILVFDWRALAELKTVYTDADLDDITKGKKPEAIAKSLAIGLHKYHPEITEKMIMDISPPFIESVEALGASLTYAYFGPDGVSEKKPLRKVLLFFLRMLMPSRKPQKN